MAYFVEMAQSTGTAGATVNANMPTHAIDDYLIAYVTLDTGTITLPGGWAALTSAPANPVSNGIVTYLAFKKATSTTETFSVTTADAYTIGIYCFRDVDTTTPFDGVVPKNTTGATGYAVTSESITTTTANALVVYLVAQETPSTTPSAVLINPGVMWIDGFDSTGITATTSAHQAAAWYINRTAGASPTPTWQSNVTSTFTRAVFALRNKSGGRIPAYIDDVSAPAEVITHAHHVGTTVIGGVNFPAALTTTTAINGKTVAASTATAQGDYGINPYASGAGRTAAITARTALNGYEINFAATKNLSSGLLMGSLIALNPKSGTFGLGSIAQGGMVARVGSAAGNWEAYQIAAKDTNVTTENRYIFAIQPGDLTTDYGTPGLATNTAAVKYVQFLMNCPAFAANIVLSELHQVYTQVVAGGDANFPVGTDDLVAVGKSFILPVFQKTGASGMVANAPIQIGGGDAVSFQIDSGVLQFPRIYDTANKEIAYHAAINRVGISYAGKSGDVIKHTNSLVSAPSEYYWEIHTAATSEATWDFSGLSIIGARVTLRPVTTFSEMAFTSCTGHVTTNGSTITGCEFINTRAVVDSPASANLISSSSFTKTTGTNYAIEITGTVEDITLSGLNFTGYATNNGSTGNEAIFINISDVVDASYVSMPAGAAGVGANTSAVAQGQSFTSQGGVLVGAAFNVFKQVSATSGVCYAVLYAHSGIFGTSSVGTGSALAISNPINIVDLPTAQTSINFTFSDGYVMGTQNYVIALYVPVASSTNYVNIGRESSNVTSGNSSFMSSAGVWNASSNTDLPFKVITRPAMNISIIGGGSVPSIRTAGATVNVITGQATLQLVGIVPGSDIVILQAGTSTEIVNINSNSTSTYDYTYTYNSGTYIDVCVYKAGYIPFTQRNYLLGSSNASLPISQVADRNYYNPA